MRKLLLFFKLLFAHNFEFYSNAENQTDGEVVEYTTNADRELVSNVKLWEERTKNGNIAFPFSFEQWFPTDGKAGFSPKL